MSGEAGVHDEIIIVIHTLILAVKSLPQTSLLPCFQFTYGKIVVINNMFDEDNSENRSRDTTPKL